MSGMPSLRSNKAELTVVVQLFWLAFSCRWCNAATAAAKAAAADLAAAAKAAGKPIQSR